MRKTRIAIFDLTGCDGCEFHLLSLNEQLLDFFQDFEIVNWRLLAEKEKADFDVALIEGAVTNKEQVKLLKEIRKTSKIVVAMGACAISGNIFAQIPKEKRRQIAEKIYNKNYKLKAEFLEPVKKFIRVDKEIPGCPVKIELFKKFLSSLKGKKISSKIKKVSLPEFVAKIEGHGSLKVNFKAKKVNFIPEEGERFVEELLVGKNFIQAPFIVSRICGICPIAHNICAISAIENALKIKVRSEILLLRRILLAGQIVKSHLLHLFFLVLPEKAGLKSSFALAKKYPAEFHLMLNIKRISDKILKAIGGSLTFPKTPTIGGFKSVPDLKNLIKIKEEIFEVLDEAEDLILLFKNLSFPKISKKVEFLTVKPSFKSYPLYPTFSFPKFKEKIQKSSPAKVAFLLPKKIVKVGALARLFYFSNCLSLKAKKIFKKIKLDFSNPFSNNLAQALEVLNFLEEIINLIERVEKKFNLINIFSQRIKLPKKEVSGEYALEAPRGVLYHKVIIDSKGKIKKYNIIPPTQINLLSLEREAEALLKKELKTKDDFSKIKKEIEELIRAFDPCITCAVH